VAQRQVVLNQNPEKGMTLVVDLGNSNIACGVFDGEELVARFRLRTSVEQTADEYEALLRGILAGKGITADGVRRVVIGSVVPDLTEPLARAVESICRTAPLVLRPGLLSGLTICIDNPRELGIDLLADAVAAHYRYGSTGHDCIVIDFGTALTFTTVTAGGNVLGVAIAPGIKSAMEALFSNTAQLPHIALEPPPSVIGTNSIHSIQSGVVYGYAGLVQSMIQRIKAELAARSAGKANVLVISTGGYSPVITGEVPEIDHLEPDLTLEGLLRLADMQDSAG
jgi:type III pantothenate kinase